MQHDEMFERLCKPSFDNIKETQAEILHVLKGKDGDPGLCEQVRDQAKRINDLEQTRGTARKAVIFVVCAFVLQSIASAWGLLSKIWHVN
jgi:hypothetical protein